MIKKTHRFYTYVHRRADNGNIFYVGSAGERIKSNPSFGYSRARQEIRRSAEWGAVVREAGGFTHEIVYEGCCEPCARKKEIALINAHWGSIVNKRKQAIAWSTERRTSHGVSGVNHPRFGKMLSEETKKKKSMALLKNHHLRGKKLPKEWRDNIAAAVTGEKNVMYGRVGSMHPSSRKVINEETGEIFHSVKEASESVGIKMKTLYNQLSGHRRNSTRMRFMNG